MRFVCYADGSDGSRSLYKLTKLHTLSREPAVRPPRLSDATLECALELNDINVSVLIKKMIVSVPTCASGEGFSLAKQEHYSYPILVWGTGILYTEEPFLRGDQKNKTHLSFQRISS